MTNFLNVITYGREQVYSETRGSASPEPKWRDIVRALKQEVDLQGSAEEVPVDFFMTCF